MNSQLQRVQDAAWTIKDSCDDLAPRKLSERDLAALASIERDLRRLDAKLVAIRDKRKRDKGEAPADSLEPAPLFEEGNGHG